jgi:23S rRNA (uracil1939-C5)-methyltransferase
MELKIIAMAHGGSGLGRHQKQTIFVPYTIPGEVIEAEVTQDKGRIAFAKGTRLVEASADRVFPACPHFGPGKCGGCHWQHIDYAAQALIKQDVLADQLARIGGFDDADVQAIIPSAVEWHYRHQMTFYRDDKGAWTLPSEDGYFAIDTCHILHPALLDLLESIDFDTDGIPRMTLVKGSNDDDTMIILHVATEDDAPELEADLNTSVNLILPDNEPVNLIGSSHVTYTIGDNTFRVTAGSAFRANVAQIENLVHIIMAHIPPGSTVLDLYAGVGVLSAFIAPHVDLVTVVESYPPAATDADENLSAFDNVDILEGNVEDILDALDQAEADYSVAVLDPPTSGLSKDALDGLGDSDIPRLIYISGDPATLARDAKRLAEKGYVLGQIMPIDISPQTYHVDAVAVFDR